MRPIASILCTISILGLTSIQGAHAQSDGKSSLGDIHKEHPEWFTVKGVYRPCPASVAFANGRSACLGCPTHCRFHF
jgi:hypothetical protein